MKYESLIFDIDGTLWDALTLKAEAWNQMFVAEGIEQYCVTKKDIIPLMGKTAEEIADILFFDMPSQRVRHETMRRCAEMEYDYLAKHECDVGYNRVKETIQILAKTHRIFIVSNSDKGYPEICIEKMGLKPYVQGHLCHGDTLQSKGKTIRLLMDRYQIERCVYIGDTQHDYEATLEAGIPFIWASFGFGKCENYTDRINEFSELLEIC